MLLKTNGIDLNSNRPWCRNAQWRVASRSAFSLVEIMIVIVIIGLLSSVVTVSVRSYMISSKQNVARMEISKISQGLETFYATYDRYPTNQEGIAILTASSNEFPEGLLSFVPQDPWGNPYEYVCPGASAPYEILCYGADHREGGSGANKDLSSMELGHR